MRSQRKVRPAGTRWSECGIVRWPVRRCGRMCISVLSAASAVSLTDMGTESRTGRVPVVRLGWMDGWLAGWMGRWLIQWQATQGIVCIINAARQ